MKKLALVLALAASSIAVNAEVFVGGAIGLMHQKTGKEESKTEVTFAPEVGFKLNEKVSLGTKLSYQLISPKNGVETSSFNLSPYVRYGVATWGNLRLFVDGVAQVGWHKTNNTNSLLSWGLGVRPGLSVDLTKRVSFITHFGELGYTNFNESAIETFGYKFDTSSVNFGVLFNF